MNRLPTIAALGAAVLIGATPAGASCACYPDASPAQETVLSDDAERPVWIGADAGGGVHALFRPRQTLQPQLVSSLDDGETWSPPHEVGIDPGVVLADTPAIFADGDLLLMYPTPSQLVMIRSSDRGASFSAAETLAEFTETVRYGWASASSPRGVAVLAWAESGPSAPWPFLGVFARVSGDGGLTWGPVQRIDPDLAVNGSVPGLHAAVSDASILIAWQRQDIGGSYAPMISSRSDDLGGSWGAAENVTPSDGWLGNTQLGATSDGRFQFVYTRNDGSGIELSAVATRTEDGGWSPRRELLQYRTGLDDVRLTSLPSGRVHVTYGADWTGAKWLVSSYDHGAPGTWLAETDVLTSAVSPSGLRVVEAPEGVLNVVHGDQRHAGSGCPDPATLGECSSIMLDRSCTLGLTWLEDELRLDADDGVQRNPSMWPEVAVSSSGRIHAVWTEGSAGPEYELHHRFVEAPAPPRAVVTVTELPGPDCQVSSFELAVDPAGLTDCVVDRVIWFEDGWEIPGADGLSYSLPVDTPAGAHRYDVSVTCEGRPDCTLDSEPGLIEIAGSLPVDVIETPGDTCRRSVYTLGARPGEVVDCDDAVIAWRRGGVLVPGATGVNWTVPEDEEPGRHEYGYTVTCTTPRACETSSEPVLLEITEFPRPLAGATITGSLTVTKAALGELRLSWSDDTAFATAHDVSVGRIGAWSSHEGLACWLPRDPVDATTFEAVVAAPPANAYFLIAPADCLDEGSLGTDSFGRPRPPASPASGPAP